MTTKPITIQKQVRCENTAYRFRSNTPRRERRVGCSGPASSSSSSSPPPGEEGEDAGVAPSVDTPGGCALGVEMEGFTWEDGPLSDDEVWDVEMA